MKHLNFRSAWLFVCLPLSGTLLAQSTITGKIISSDKQTPLAGATIKVKGATAIDVNGKPVIVSQTAQLGQPDPQLVAAAETNTGRRNSTNTERLDYIQQQDVEGSKRINGAIFEADIDISHPIAFGLNTRKLFINKNGPTLLLPSTNKYATVAQYTKAPFINGYSSKNNIARVANSAAILLSPNGSGEVVLFADDPTYRSYWLGTNRLFLNAIFFAPLLGNGFGYGQ